MKCRWFLAGVLLGALAVVGPLVSEADAAVTGVYSELVQAEVQGFVFYTDGKTPAGKVPVRVYDVAQRKFIHETETNDFGFYRLPELEPGEYLVTFDWTKLRLRIGEPGEDAVQQPHHVIVVIPRDVGYVTLPQLSAVIFATSVSEMARRYEMPEQERRPKVVSP